MELIGQWCLGDSTKPVRDAAAALVFSAIEPAIPEAIDEALKHHRPGAWDHQVLTAPRIFRLELLQASQPHHSFKETLRAVWQVWRHAGLVNGPLPSSSALAQARARQPTRGLEAFFRHTAAATRRWPRHPLCPEHRLRAIDGVPLLVPRTPRNFAHFGTTRSQHGDAYYPQALAVWASQIPGFVVTAEYLGRAGESDQSVAPQMLDGLVEPDDLILGDGHFGTYPCVAVIQRRQAFHLVRATGTFIPEKHRIGPSDPDDADLRVTPTPYIRRRYRAMALPEALPLRAVTRKDPRPRSPESHRTGRLPDQSAARRFPRQRLATLTPLRWGEETLHNDIKTRLGLGEIRSRDPAGVRREILAHLCRSNLLRLFLSTANPSAPWEGSFTAARSALAQANHQLRWQPDQHERIFRLLAEMIRNQPLDVRPGRAEPRRKRPDRRPYPTFKTPRSDWRTARKAG